MEQVIKTPITQKQFDNICDLIESTPKSLKSICDELHISQQSVYNYMNIVGDVAKEKYARVKAVQVENIMDEINDLEQKCIDATLDETIDPKSKNAIVQAYKLKCDNLKWFASKLIPKKYGDKLDITSNGLSVTREISISLPGKLNDGAKVSTYPNATETSNNDKLSSV